VKRLIATAAVGMLVLTGCGGKMTEPFKDADVGQENSAPADLLRMPDGFSNVAAKCDGTTRVYTVFHGDNPYGSVAVSPNHPACGGTR
jgi:hypothetical protein